MRKIFVDGDGFVSEILVYIETSLVRKMDDILASKIEIPHPTFVLRVFDTVLIRISLLEITYYLPLFTGSLVAFLIFAFVAASSIRPSLRKVLSNQYPFSL